MRKSDLPLHGRALLDQAFEYLQRKVDSAEGR
jgi:hypothetical protein